MIKIISNALEGLYAVPSEHPVTCANPAPWKIEEMRFDHEWDREKGGMAIKVFIRNNGSFWFRADQCFLCDDIEECKLYMEMHKIN